MTMHLGRVFFCPARKTVPIDFYGVRVLVDLAGLAREREIQYGWMS